MLNVPVVLKSLAYTLVIALNYGDELNAARCDARVLVQDCMYNMSLADGAGGVGE